MEASMSFQLPDLPYPLNALEPYISQETLEYHHGKHHKAYVTKLNELIPNTEFENASLEDIICKARPGPIFNNAAQVWNHTFYWHCMKPKGGGKPAGKLAEAINQYFGAYETFQQKLTEAGLTQFGSGWAWLVKTPDGKLEVVKTANGDNPMTEKKKPLLTCDVWEHAYYIDTRNDRGKYINNFWNVVNWDFVAKNFAG
jgi:superoxide dismutase, Fe-Mn family